MESRGLAATTLRIADNPLGAEMGPYGREIIASMRFVSVCSCKHNGRRGVRPPSELSPGFSMKRTYHPHDDPAFARMKWILLTPKEYRAANTSAQPNGAIQLH